MDGERGGRRKGQLWKVGRRGCVGEGREGKATGR